MSKGVSEGVRGVRGLGKGVKFSKLFEPLNSTSTQNVRMSSQLGVRGFS
jgi:hypothetical protein